MSAPTLANFRSAPALLAFALTAVLGLTTDLVTKAVAFQQLAPLGVRYVEERGRHEIVLPPDGKLIVVEGIPGWLHFQGMVNEGAVFGIGQGQRWFFVAISILATGFILRLFAASGDHRFYQFVLGMLLAGVLGNMYDRVNFGFVRDMIFMLPGRRWPGTGKEIFPWIFNIADTMLCVGVGMIFLYVLRGSPGSRDARTKKAPATEAVSTAKT